MTLQLFHHDAVPDLAMELREGGKDGPAVPILLSTPNQPGNPELTPRGAFCLIPVKHLKAGTKYTVKVIGFPDRADWSWTFTTGSGN